MQLYNPSMGQVFPSWSASRAKAWRACRRQWFFQYAHTGESFEKKAQLLKDLSTPEMEAGKLVETEIKWDLWNLQKGKPLASLDEAIYRAQADLAERIRLSPINIARLKAKQEGDDKLLVMFHDVYKKPLDPTRLERTKATINTCLTNWRAGTIWLRLQESDRQGWMSVSHPRSSAIDSKKWWLDGIKVYSPCDFYHQEGERVFLYDWKTGREDEHYHREQMAAYAAYLVHSRKKPLGSLQSQLVYLREGADHNPGLVSETILNAFEGAVKDGIAAELEHAEERNGVFEVKQADYPTMPNRNECAWCNFLKLCPEGREVLNLAARDAL